MACFRSFEERLGSGAQLSIHFALLSPSGQLIKQDGYHFDRSMPMASTVKIAIALLVLKRVFADHAFSPDTSITIKNEDFVPGPPWNSLDRYFFFPWAIQKRKTIDELLTLMLCESDNTATDKLLALVGGASAVNSLIHDLGVRDFYLASNLRRLLAHYYSFPGHKSVINSMRVLWTFMSAFRMRSTEYRLFDAGMDACSARGMTQLLSLIVTASLKTDDTWITKASQVLCLKMQGCRTGFALIRQGLRASFSHQPIIGDKTGSLGGILNDVAHIHMPTGYWVMLSILTARSPLGKKHRQRVVSEVTQHIFHRNIHPWVMEHRSGCGPM